MNKRNWFLTHPRVRGDCRSLNYCEAPATGYDSEARELCCGECNTVAGCQCSFNAQQKRIVIEMPIEMPIRKQPPDADLPEAREDAPRAKACP